MIHVYGHAMSTCTRKVLTTLHETQTPFELHVVDFAKGEHKMEPHLARQPFGQLPALDDDGFGLFESRAMARYVDAKAGGKLTPTDARLRAKMDQWMSVEVEDFSPNAMKFVYHTVFKREQTPEVLEAAAKKLDTACAILDKNLDGKAFLVGDQFTLADLSYAPYLEYAMADATAKGIFQKYPHLMSWWGRVSERASWRKVTGRA